MIYADEGNWSGEILSRASETEPMLAMVSLSRFVRFLRACVETPTIRIFEIPILEEKEARSYVQWNDTSREYEGGWIHELVEEQARTRPDAIAVVFEEEQISYGELNRQANVWAHRLRMEGVGADTAVGVCLERSVELVVGLLAVMKAGGAYLPLDPGYPEQRLGYMLEEAGARVVLTKGEVGSRLPATVVQLRMDGEAGEGEESDPKSEVEAGNLIYIIYTSGSTGRPKGVGNTHGGLRNRVKWMQSEYELSEEDGVMQKTPTSFDVSFWEFFWPLVSGARLVVARPEGHRDPEYLRGLIGMEEVTVVHFVPSMLGAFLERGGGRVRVCDKYFAVERRWERNR